MSFLLLDLLTLPEYVAVGKPEIQGKTESFVRKDEEVVRFLKFTIEYKIAKTLENVYGNPVKQSNLTVWVFLLHSICLKKK